ncbi:leucine-rich repeat protein [Pseudoflavonifractor sp. BIOML-A1]|nr:leucine-rich repeat protein [Pseudoflavonifractor sp. BIOML-A1]
MKLKRALAVLLCAVLLMVGTPLALAADEEGSFPNEYADFLEDGIAYKIVDHEKHQVEVAPRYKYAPGGAHAAGSYYCETSYEIPASVTHEGTEYAIVGIAAGAFVQAGNITSITFAADSEIEYIGDDAFGATSLTSITIPASIKEIGGSVFTPPLSGTATLSTIVFEANSQLEKIGFRAFWHCRAVTSLTLPESVKSIEGQAFADSGIENLSIPAGVSDIAADAFDGYDHIDTLTIVPENLAYSLEGGTFSSSTAVLRQFDKTATSVTVPEGVTALSEDVFKGCAGLETISLPDSLRTIGRGAFSGCAALKSITLPDDVTELPDATTSVNGVFTNCSSLESVTMPSVTTIGKYAFSGCSSLKSIDLPDTLTSVGQNAFRKAGLTSIVIPASVTTLEQNSFATCADLASVVIPASVTSIGKNAFNGALKKDGSALVMQGETVPTIDENAFKNVAATLTVYYPEAAKDGYEAEVSFTGKTKSGFALNVDKPAVTAYSGDTVKLALTMTKPVGAEVTWTANQPDIADIASSSDADLVLNVKSAGKATFTGTMKVGGLALISVTVDLTGETVYVPPSTPSKPGTTVTNPDGSTTTTKTDANGTVTETPKGPDGSTTVVETRKDGTVTEKQETADGVKSETVTRPDGSMTAEVETADGSKGTTTVTAGGETRAEATVTVKAVETAARAEAPVVLPVAPVAAAKTSGAAPVVSVTLPSSAGAVAVKVPVAGVTAGTVAVLVHADGTEEIVMKSTVDADGVALTLDGSATIKIVDNSKAFADTAPVSGWAGDAIDFVTSRELFQGTGENAFSPLMTTDRAMIATVIWRREGRQSAAGAAPADVPSDAWYADAMAWAVEQGIVNPDNGSVSPAAPVTREQLAVMLYRLSGAPAVSTSVSGQVSAWAADAMAWAVEQGLIQGDGASLNAGATATRAEVSAILMRYISL